MVIAAMAPLQKPGSYGPEQQGILMEEFIPCMVYTYGKDFRVYLNDFLVTAMNKMRQQRSVTVKYREDKSRARSYQT